MDTKTFFRYRLYFAGFITLAMWLLLAWDYFHGGIPAHHILNKHELPAISNGWGGFLIPLLTWYLLYRIQKRNQQEGNILDLAKLRKAFFMSLLSAIYALIIALAFTFDYNVVSEYMFNGLLVLALIFPLYRAEYYLGFVLGLTYFFGGVLPCGIGLVIVLISAAANFGLHPILVKIKNKLKSL
jgi:hypothetical protein